MQSNNQARPLTGRSFVIVLFTLVSLLSLNVGILFVLGDSDSQSPKSQTVHDEVRAKKFTLVDDAGVERGEFAIKADGVARMMLWNKNKSMFATVYVNEDDNGMPVIGVGTSSRKPLAQIAMADEHTPLLMMRDRNGTGRIVLMIEQNGVASMQLTGEQRIGGLSMWVNRPANSGFTMRDEKGNKRASITVDDSATASLYLNNTKDGPGIVLLVDGNDEPAMASFDKDGKPIWVATPSRVPSIDKAKRP